MFYRHPAAIVLAAFDHPRSRAEFEAVANLMGVAPGVASAARENLRSGAVQALVVSGPQASGKDTVGPAVMAALGASPPSYAHVPLWRDSRGERLSKREGAEGLAGYHQLGLDAAAVVGELAASAALVPAGSRLSAAELLQQLSSERLDQVLRDAQS